MSKAVLISIRPKWCEKIVNGEKTVEVRKTRPKLQTPFKCYIYCTLQGMNDFFRAELGGDVARWNRGKWSDRKGAVIGEFTCDRVYRLVTSGPGGSYSVDGEDKGTTNRVARQSCLGLSDMHAYLKSKTGYGLHISGLKVYDAPDGETFTGYYNADATDKAVFAHHIQSDVTMDIIRENIETIKRLIEEVE